MIFSICLLVLGSYFSYCYFNRTGKHPTAIWQNEGEYKFIDENGNIIQDANESSSINVLLVVGSDAAENIPELLKALEDVPSIKEKVRSAVRIEYRRWDLHLFDAEQGIKILLPETDVNKALKRLVLQNQKDNLLSKNIAAIDLRLPDRITVHPLKKENRR